MGREKGWDDYDGRVDKALFLVLQILMQRAALYQAMAGWPAIVQRRAPIRESRRRNDGSYVLSRRQSRSHTARNTPILWRSCGEMIVSQLLRSDRVDGWPLISY